jgi:hypothetical protein
VLASIGCCAVSAGRVLTLASMACAPGAARRVLMRMHRCSRCIASLALLCKALLCKLPNWWFLANRNPTALQQRRTTTNDEYSRAWNVPIRRMAPMRQIGPQLLKLALASALQAASARLDRTRFLRDKATPITRSLHVSGSPRPPSFAAPRRPSRHRTGTIQSP